MRLGPYLDEPIVMPPKGKARRGTVTGCALCGLTRETLLKREGLYICRGCYDWYLRFTRNKKIPLPVIGMLETVSRKVYGKSVRVLTEDEMLELKKTLDDLAQKEAENNVTS